jgi:glycerol-3-phosphate cytidylyltransferase
MLKPYKKGYTTGVFDVFHVGHLNILKHAKEKCEYLVVGISTDELVRACKSKTPVIPFEERMEIVASIKYVDEVVPQRDKNKYEAWKRHRFDVMFVGDDWKGSKIFKDTEEKFRPHGVEIVYFPYTKGVSSTLLQEKIKNYPEVKSVEGMQ